MIDESKVAEHSKLAQDYYDAIMSKENIDSAKARFKEGCKSGNVEILLSYKEEGRKTLIRSLLANANSLLRMTEFLLKHVPKYQWKNFLANLHQDDLFKIILELDLPTLRIQYRQDEFGTILCQQTDPVLRKLSEVKYELESEEELRALMVCLLQVYRVSRQEGPEFKSTLGYMGSLFSSWAHSKDSRIQSCDVLLNFLVSEPPYPLADFVSYLHENHFNEHISPLTVSAYLDCNNTTLFKLTKLMLDTALQFSCNKSSTPSLSYHKGS
jgi:hypothetical protein